MLKTYAVLGRNVRADPDVVYIKPSFVTVRKLIEGTADFYEINIEPFLDSINGLPKELHGDFYVGMELHLMECRSALGFIESMQGEYNAEKVVMDGPVEFPSPRRTEELKDGIRNTIYLFEQLQK